MYLTVEVVEQVLQRRGYQEKNRTKKVVAYQLGECFPLYVNLENGSGENALVVHPESEIRKLSASGTVIDKKFCHSSNLRLFPRRINKGKDPIAYGIGISFQSHDALLRCLNFLETEHVTRSAVDTRSSAAQQQPLLVSAVPSMEWQTQKQMQMSLSHEQVQTVSNEIQPEEALVEVLPADWSDRTLLPGQDVLVQTTRRVGHDGFRRALEDYWGGACAITGVHTTALLRASHIKPWAVCEPEEQTSVFNGLLLAAHWDAAFDRGLITLDVHGTVVLSPQLSEDDAAVLGFVEGMRLRKPMQPQHLPYLAYHRQHVFIAG